MTTEEKKVDRCCIKKEIINHNIEHAKAILHDCEMCNKGRHSHAINKGIYELRSLIKGAEKGNSCTFERMCKCKQYLGSLLWDAQQGR